MLKKITYSLKEKGVHLNLKAVAARFENVCVLDSNLKANRSDYLGADMLVAIGVEEECSVTNTLEALGEIQAFLDKNSLWKFGYLSYDLKNSIEDLTSLNPKIDKSDLAYFFVPTFVLKLEGNGELVIEYDDEVSSVSDVRKVYDTCFDKEVKVSDTNDLSISNIKAQISKNEYLSTVSELKEHILKGDIYEVNFCQAFYANNSQISPVGVYEKLSAISSAPFAAFCKFSDQYVMGASPERYLQKRGGKLVSQPIKGTVKRSDNDLEDSRLKEGLLTSEKERSENVMIVDLVRNDLSRIAKRGTVQVEELLGLYTYKQVHQLVSTVSCKVKKDVSFTDILRATFPMGSMTGAPKVSAMKLIERYEKASRGLYSGAIGYIAPNGDFDFNVVIRSILYNETNKDLSFTVGGAITHNSDAEQEYAECLLKAKALFEVLLGKV